MWVYCTSVPARRISPDVFVQIVRMSFSDTSLGSSSKMGSIVSLQLSILARFTAVSEGAKVLHSAFLFAFARALVYALVIPEVSILLILLGLDSFAPMGWP